MTQLDVRLDLSTFSADPLPVMVSSDGSRNSEAAVVWAAGAAAKRSTPLTVVYVLEQEMILRSALPREELDAHAKRMVQEILDRARALYPDVEASIKVVVGSPAEALVKEAGDNHLLVVARRGHGGFGRMLMGSTSTAVANRARCPLVVVPDDWEPPPVPGPVVVGIDSSQENETAAQVAFSTAAASGLPLHAVRTWHVDTVFSGRMAEVIGGFEKYEQEARDELAKTVERWSSQYPDVEVHQQVRRGHRVEALAAAAVDASILIAGTHGRRRLGGAPLGSVTRGILHHASVPVAVIPRSKS